MSYNDELLKELNKSREEIKIYEDRQKILKEIKQNKQKILEYKYPIIKIIKGVINGNK